QLLAKSESFYVARHRTAKRERFVWDSRFWQEGAAGSAREIGGARACIEARQSRRADDRIRGRGRRRGLRGVRHRIDRRKLGLPSDQRRALLTNLTRQLVRHGYVHTTEGRAKELRRIVEPLITLAKKD